MGRCTYIYRVLSADMECGCHLSKTALPKQILCSCFKEDPDSVSRWGLSDH